MDMAVYDAVKQVSSNLTHYMATYWTPLRHIYQTVILQPLARLYVWGPSWGQWGFWNGRPKHDICAQITQVPSDFWLQHPEECIAVIGNTFYSLIVLWETIGYLILLWWFVKLVVRLVSAAITKALGASFVFTSEPKGPAAG